MALTNLNLLVVRYPYAARRALPTVTPGDIPYIVTRRLNSVNFSHGDEVTTEFIFNSPATEDAARYNYLVESDTSNLLLSAWYVTSCERVTQASKFQYRLKLRRDVVSEYFSSYKNLPFYAERGWINDGASPLLFQGEGVSTDKVKTAEYPIKDETRMQWIVGYMAPNFDSSVKSVSIPGTSEKSAQAVASFATLADFYAYIGASGDQTNLLAFTYANLGVRYKYGIGSDFSLILPRGADIAGVDSSGNYAYGVNPKPINSFTSFEAHQASGYTSYAISRQISQLAAAPLYSLIQDKGMDWSLIYKSVAATHDGAPGAYMTPSGYDRLRSLIARVIYIEDIKINYLVGVTSSSFIKKGSSTSTYKKSDETGIYNYVASNINASPTVEGVTFSGELGDDSVYMTCAASEVDIDLIQIDAQAATWTPRSTDTIPTAEHGPYKLFCAPYYDGRIPLIKAGGTITEHPASLVISKAMAIKYMTAIAEAYGTACYDIQIVPYCPAREIITSVTYGGVSYETFAVDLSSTVDYIKDASGEVLFPIIWTANDSGTVYRQTAATPFLDYSKRGDEPTSEMYAQDTSLRIDELAQAYGLEAKIKDITELWRLVSPNWQGQAFEFSPQRNGGVSAFRIDFTYRPNSPFIIVRPSFGGLYGYDAGDDRGLVCGGDFSMPRTSSEWAEYQLRNINYENIFNRQYKTLDLNIREQRIEGILSGIAGTAAGTAKGATMGAGAGSSAGPAGAIVGAVIGGATALAGGVADMALDEAIRKDQLSASRDLHRMDLQNIQARPESLARGGYQIVINRNFPTLEYYVAPDEEVQAIRNNIEYGGMTIGADTTIADVIGPSGYTWVQGSFETLGRSFDNATARALRDEFQAGVWIPAEIGG